MNRWLRTTIKGIVALSIILYVSYLDSKWKCGILWWKPYISVRACKINCVGGVGWGGEQRSRLCENSPFGTDHLPPCSRVCVRTHGCWLQHSLVSFRFHRCYFVLGNCLSYVRLMVQGMNMTLVKFRIRIPVWTQFSIQEMYRELVLSGWLSPSVDSWWLPSCYESLLNSLKNSTLSCHHLFGSQREKSLSSSLLAQIIWW